MYPESGNTRRRWTLFGNAAIVAFLLAQVLDGVLTYVGVQTFGHRIEGNPVLAWLMQAVGPGTALAGAKAVAASFGAFLHLVEVHVIVAALTAVYLAAAVVPWTALLFFH